MTGNKDNTIFNDMDETLGYYKDIVALYQDLINGATKRNDMEEVKLRAEELDEINEYRDHEGLLVLSENNGMGFTCKPYKEGHENE